jgi:hypothetical protein
MYRSATVECPTTVVTEPGEDGFDITGAIPVVIIGALVGAVVMDMLGIDLI